VRQQIRFAALHYRYGPHTLGNDLDANERAIFPCLAHFATAMYAELEAVELRQRITLLEQKLKAPNQRVR